MGSAMRRLAWLALVVAFAGALETAGAQTVGPVSGKEKSASGKAAGKPDPAAGQRSLEAGIKAYEAGKTSQAIQSLSVAVQGGGLANPQMAKALYYRGLSYRKEGKPALAISDLTSALWLKGGLNEAERAEATAARAAAYGQAGLDDKGGIAVATAPAPAPRPTAVPQSSTTSSWQASQVVTGSTTEAASPVLSAAPVEANPASEGTQSQVNPVAGIGSFFSNLFSGSSGSTAKAEPASAATTLAAPTPQTDAGAWAPTASAASAAPAAPATSGWGNATRVTKARETRLAAAPPATVIDAPGATGAHSGGKYSLQVAAVRSRQEADAIVAQLFKDHRFQIGDLVPEVDTTVIGNMGTFYRVRLGPYAEANEPSQFCKMLKTRGFDCMIVAQ